MERNYFIGLLGLISMFMPTSCRTTSLYSWYGYDNQIYEFTKKRTPENETELTKTYEKLINTSSDVKKTVQPGICAEYGYLLLKSDKKEEGLAMFKKEIESYSESAIFISRITKQFEKRKPTIRL